MWSGFNCPHSCYLQSWSGIVCRIPITYCILTYHHVVTVLFSEVIDLRFKHIGKHETTPRPKKHLITLLPYLDHLMSHNFFKMQNAVTQWLVWQHIMQQLRANYVIERVIYIRVMHVLQNKLCVIHSIIQIHFHNTVSLLKLICLTYQL